MTSLIAGARLRQVWHIDERCTKGGGRKDLKLCHILRSSKACATRLLTSYNAAFPHRIPNYLGRQILPGKSMNSGYFI